MVLVLFTAAVLVSASNLAAQPHSVCITGAALVLGGGPDTQTSNLIALTCDEIPEQPPRGAFGHLAKPMACKVTVFGAGPLPTAARHTRLVCQPRSILVSACWNVLCAPLGIGCSCATKT